jgi:hypothetical protein
MDINLDEVRKFFCLPLDSQNIIRNKFAADGAVKAEIAAIKKDMAATAKKLEEVQLNCPHHFTHHDRLNETVVCDACEKVLEYLDD